ncbi:MAG: diacylglycerol kinase, partial [Bacteroidetes bacterium]|nr:diacylglycerol kinase [Bacteroidota bacterium]
MATYLSKRNNAFKAAFQGVALFFKEEAHAKIHLACAIAAIIISVLLHLSLHDFIIILLLILL